jgi:hypothetical protein
VTSKSAKRNGGVVIPRSAMPPSRTYPDIWGELWKAVGKLNKKSSYEVRPVAWGSTVNALRCALRRAKQQGRVDPDVRVRGGDDVAYLYRQ